MWLVKWLIRYENMISPAMRRILRVKRGLPSRCLLLQGVGRGPRSVGVTFDRCAWKVADDAAATSLAAGENAARRLVVQSRAAGSRHEPLPHHRRHRSSGTGLRL